MVWVWICEPLAFLVPNNIWFKAHFLITVLNSGNYSLRLRALLFFFIDLLKCSNLWWLSGISFLPLILSPHSFPLCLSLRSCPQTSLGLLKELRLFFFFKAEPVSSFLFHFDAHQKKAMTVSARAGGSVRQGLFGGLSSSWGALEPLDPVACAFLFMPGFEVVLVKASFGKLFLSLTWQASGMGFASAYLRVGIDVCAGGFYVWHFCIRGAAALTQTLARSLRVTHIHTLVPIFSPVDSILSTRWWALLSHLSLFFHSSLHQESLFQHLTFNPLIPPMHSVRCFSIASNWYKMDLWSLFWERQWQHWVCLLVNNNNWKTTTGDNTYLEVNEEFLQAKLYFLFGLLSDRTMVNRVLWS